jgi:hypothetical protein
MQGGLVKQIEVGSEGRIEQTSIGMTRLAWQTLKANPDIHIEGCSDFVANARSCGICGGPADRHGCVFQCQMHPGHLADTLTGIFSDCTYPVKAGI